jgi:murein DD-endopeptidase MepM/ murein hydrolase activator NlpD
MTETLLERVWAWLHATFPERQIYIRSDGRVEFFTFGPTLQATLAGLSLIFLGWVAFASVNVIFKDRIIAAKNHRYQLMQTAYESRVADLQDSYDELNNALVAAQDRFKAKADELQAKQETINSFLNRKKAVDSVLASLGSSKDTFGTDTDSDVIRTAPGAGGAMASDSVVPGGPPPQQYMRDMRAAPSVAGSGSSELEVMPEGIEPQPRTAKPVKAGFLDATLGRFAAMLFPAKRERARPSANLPGLRILTEQTERVATMGGQETAMLQGVDRAISGRVEDLQAVLSRVGINSSALEDAASEGGGVGGPEVPIQAARIDGISDSDFTAAYLRATAHVEELDTLFAALHHVPLTTPVRGEQFEITSGFGPRIDPFTHRLAFHPGIDFAGPWGATVTATAAGVVVWAGPRSGYGNLVEIDHGYGFRTRYGHLAAVSVEIGTHVDKGAPIGKLGSTGRSTGPHVHYEVWLADTLRDPSRFIGLGRQILQ